MSKSSSDGEVCRRHFKHKAWWMQRLACKNHEVEWKRVILLFLESRLRKHAAEGQEWRVAEMSSSAWSQK